MSDRVISSESNEFDEQFELSLDLNDLSQYIGQHKVKENLKIFIEAAKIREESLDHVLVIWASWTRENNTCHRHCK